MAAGHGQRIKAESSCRVGISGVVLLAAGGVMWRLPHAAGTTWADVGASLAGVGLADLSVLALVWAAGLWCHSWVLKAALPGLSTRRALLLNLSGSAVCDVLPFGAAAGTGVSLLMIRSWRIPMARFATFTTVSNLWNVLAKLGLPALVLALALATPSVHGWPLMLTAIAALVLSLVIGGIAAAIIGSQRFAVTLGRAADRATAAIAAATRSSRRSSLPRSPFEVALPAVRADIAGVIRSGWGQLTAGMSGYLLLQAVLWWLCLSALTTGLPIPVVLASFAVERVLSMVPLTPGGAGLAEAGTIAALVSLGADPLGATAAVLLFRIFSFLIEIPVGGAALLVWIWLRRREAMGRPETTA